MTKYKLNGTEESFNTVESYVGFHFDNKQSVMILNLLKKNRSAVILTDQNQGHVTVIETVIENE